MQLGLSSSKEWFYGGTFLPVERSRRPQISPDSIHVYDDQNGESYVMVLEERIGQTPEQKVEFVKRGVTHLCGQRQHERGREAWEITYE